MAWHQWKPYVPVAQRLRSAQKKMDALRKKGVDIQPVTIDGRKIARTFWGEAWCDHLESFSDYSNRLPRGRSYVRNGSVCHLAISKGQIQAKVSGSELYDITIKISTLAKAKWDSVKKRSAGQIGSLLELLKGELSANVMEVVTDRKNGLFPQPGEIKLGCSCPDWAVMCKHVAAVLYGVGARLDDQPHLLFLLRGVDHEELITADAEAAVNASVNSGSGARLESEDLSDIFGIDITPDDSPQAVKKPVKKKSARKKVTRRKVTSRKAATKRTDATTKATPSAKSRSKAEVKKKAKKAVTAAVKKKAKKTVNQTVNKTVKAKKASTTGATLAKSAKTAAGKKAVKQTAERKTKTKKKKATPKSSKRKAKLKD